MSAIRKSGQRATSHNGALAHTSPVYVSVEGGSFRSGRDLPRLVEKRLQVLDYITGRLKDPKFTSSYTPGEPAALLERVKAAREIYRKLLVNP